ncbi:MAG: phosphoribosylanthranilate isomerase [Verrucomicrobiota bacterium]
MPVFVKICGLCSPADVRAVAELGPDAMGFVFWSGSRRHVLPDAVAEWTADLPAAILKVGVFVDATEDELRRTVETAGLDVVQLHGFQSLVRRSLGEGGLEKPALDFPTRLPASPAGPRGAGWPRTRAWGGQVFGKKAGEVSKVWTVVHLDRGAPAPDEGARVDAYLLDSYSAESPGGTGRVLDWNRAREFVRTSRKPVLLAGGLTPENVEEAIRRVQPWGVDVSSGVEQAPGRKDLARVRAFIQRCRQS